MEESPSHTLPIQELDTTHAFGMRVAIRVVLTALAWPGLFGVASQSDAALLSASQLYSKYASYDAIRYDGLGYSQASSTGASLTFAGASSTGRDDLYR